MDESSGKKLSLYLNEEGFNAQFVADVIPGSKDKEILEYAEKEDRILIANDKDFGELIFRLNRPSSGVIFLRLKIDSPKNRQEHAMNLIEGFSDKLSSSFVVVREGKIRFRKIK